MDIHKPKPWHGIREFLKEYAIIVIGVLTALGAEAVVQNLHEARLSEEARQAVRDELNLDITNVAQRFSWDVCVNRRLEEIDALLDRAEAGGAFAPPGAVGRPRDRAVYVERWETAKSGGRMSLISSDDQRAFVRAYLPLGYIAERQRDELPVWLRLQALQGRPRLSPDMITVQRLAVAEARGLDAEIHHDFRQAQFFAAKVEVKGDARLQLPPSEATGKPAMPAICEPLNALRPQNPGRR